MKTVIIKNPNGCGSVVWQTLCGVRGAGTKYLEAFRVLGNQRRILVIERRYCGCFVDKSYTKNALEVSRVCDGINYREL
jgi:hypothetical protein